MEQFIDYRGGRMREIELKKQNGGEGFYKLIDRSFDNLTQTVEQSGS